MFFRFRSGPPIRALAMLLCAPAFMPLPSWARARCGLLTLLKLLFLLCLVAIGTARADWALDIRGDGKKGGDATLVGIARDGAGNRYLAGYFSDPILEVGGVVLSLTGGVAGFLVKEDAAGNVLWARAYGAPGPAATLFRGVTVDAAGNLYVAATLSSNDWPAMGLTRIGSMDMVVLKLNGAGDPIWVRNFGGESAALTPAAIGLDVAGNIYLSGVFQSGSLSTPPVARIATSPWDRNGLVMKLDPTGNPLWAKAFGGSAATVSVSQGGMAVDADGNAYCTGYFSGGSLSTPVMSRIGNTDALLFKYDTTGNLVWARTYGGNGVTLSAVVLDGNGKLFAAGNYSGAGLTSPPLALSGTVDGLLLKLETGGNLEWATHLGSTAARVSFSTLALDGSGNPLVGGYMPSRGGPLVDPPLTRIGIRDAVVVKYDARGSVLWGRNFGGAGAQVSLASIIDDGNTIELGGSWNNASLTTPPLPRIGSTDVFSIRLDAAGNVLRASNFSSFTATSTAMVMASARDAAGNLYIAGRFEKGTLVVGSFSLAALGTNPNVFVAKLDPNGGVLWAKGYGGASATTYVCGLALDGSGNLYLAGTFTDGDLSEPALARTGGTDGLVMKLDSAGNTLWARHYGSYAAGLYLKGLALAADGGPVLVGSLGGNGLTSPVVNLIGNSDGVVIKLDTAGNPVWGRNFGGGGANANLASVSVDGSGNIYVGGNFTAALSTPALSGAGPSDGLAMKLGATGNVVWARHYGGNGVYTYVNALALDAAGNLLVGGNFRNGSLSTPPLSQRGSQDIFVQKLDPDGGAVWMQQIGSAGVTAALQALTVQPGGDIYGGGSFYGGNLSAPSLTPMGSVDGLVVRMDANGNVVWAGNYGGSGAQASVQTLMPVGGNLIDASGNFTMANLTAPALVLRGVTDGMVLHTVAAYTVSTSADAHSSVTPGSGLAVSSQPASFTVTPGTGYLANVSGCGVNLTGIAAATTVNTVGVAGDCTLSVTSAPVPTCGTAAGSASSYAPTTNLCAVGNAGAVQSGSPWTWSCANSGATIACTAPNATLPTGGNQGRIEVAGGGWTINTANSGGFVPTTGHGKSPPTLPSGYYFPYGLVDLELTGGTGPAMVTLTYSNPLPANSVYWKYGPEPRNTTPHWYIYPNAVISGNRVTLTLGDGQQGDDDLMTNGVIRDPGGPGALQAGVVDVPTLSAWATLVLATLLVLSGAIGLPRREGPHRQLPALRQNPITRR